MSGISTKELYKILNSTYTTKNNDINDWKLDRDISDDKSKVFYNPETNKTIVAHRGTQGIKDWTNNFVYAIGGLKAYKNTKRYKDASKVQNKAFEKYGKENITTIGHSQGGLQADLLGRKGYQTITYNKPHIRQINNLNSNSEDIRTSRDPISFIGYNKKFKTLPSKSLNPFKEHSIDNLKGLNKKLTFGKGGFINVKYKRL